MSKSGFPEKETWKHGPRFSKFLHTCIAFCFVLWIFSSFSLESVSSFRRDNRLSFSEAKSSSVRIPNIIHQSWKNNDVPARYKRWIQSWKELHPNWRYIFWTDHTNRKLVLRQFPWLIDIFDSLPVNIARADISRFLYMYSYGGVYADLDFRALRPFDTLLHNKCVILGMMENNFRLDDAIPNAIMASVPGHPFWLLCIRKVIDRHFLGFRGTETNFSGSLVLKEAYQDWRRIHNYTEFEGANNIRIKGMETREGSFNGDDLFPCQEVTLEPKGVLYPYSWVWEPKEIKIACDFSKESSNPDEDLCTAKILNKYPEAYSITFWTHSWSAKGSLCEKRPSLCKSSAKNETIM
ncbi:hypothetical protein GpartN1_g2463.t1 [Galdieria partita]|uniref:Uncharacterized protein n=1 Tax=Galdieria partita TaxID=83374 RepID=A0A9C7UPN0_9RHOD|nr:hypothetical protein GpartN1_g2463.t1 [Galdieria partita]